MSSGDFWRRAHDRAARKTAKTLAIDSRQQLVLKTIIILGALGALFFLGSSDASRDEMIVRAAIAAGLVLLFPFVYVWNLAGTPAAMVQEQSTEYAQRLSAVEGRIISLTDQIALLNTQIAQPQREEQARQLVAIRTELAAELAKIGQVAMVYETREHPVLPGTNRAEQLIRQLADDEIGPMCREYIHNCKIIAVKRHKHEDDHEEMAAISKLERVFKLLRPT